MSQFSTLLDIVPTPATVADGYKFAISGALLGVTLSGASEAIGDYLVDLAGIEERGDLVHEAANTVIRLTVATTGFLIADRVMRAMGSSTNDPTGGLFFHAGYLFGQVPLVTALAGMSRQISGSVKVAAGITCCGSCATGGECSQ